MDAQLVTTGPVSSGFAVVWMQSVSGAARVPHSTATFRSVRGLTCSLSPCRLRVRVRRQRDDWCYSNALCDATIAAWCRRELLALRNPARSSSAWRNRFHLCSRTESCWAQRAQRRVNSDCSCVWNPGSHWAAVSLLGAQVLPRFFRYRRCVACTQYPPCSSPSPGSKD
jgi:hypothetical protein